MWFHTLDRRQPRRHQILGEDFESRKWTLALLAWIWCIGKSDDSQTLTVQNNNIFKNKKVAHPLQQWEKGAGHEQTPTESYQVAVYSSSWHWYWLHAWVFVNTWFFWHSVFNCIHYLSGGVWKCFWTRSVSHGSNSSESVITPLSSLFPLTQQAATGAREKFVSPAFMRNCKPVWPGCQLLLISLRF